MQKKAGKSTKEIYTIYLKTLWNKEKNIDTMSTGGWWREQELSKGRKVLLGIVVHDCNPRPRVSK